MRISRWPRETSTSYQGGHGWACGIYDRRTDRLEEMTPQELLARRASVPTLEKAAIIARALRS
ncbi:hypothetical protein I6I10_02405 [Corynebacterium glucuronolyticum]|uniref:Uncharacterized protein n=1 Tax=Corynebacterium glucuronolyticum TaxID=39791 RepID=A0A7T4EG80_9CORY|nr:hypothetical protein [Corynebacterium glucuronolyticum]QQB46806.1 hypothetical protein I6I10_02405 [Corynebacterium glucuronolyticum]QQU88426.1 hypothetical protein I6I68_12835 [Corynebacterium glucuronolyticum]